MTAPSFNSFSAALDHLVNLMEQSLPELQARAAPPKEWTFHPRDGTCYLLPEAWATLHVAYMSPHKIMLCKLCPWRAD